MKISTLLKKIIPGSVFLAILIHWLSLYANTSGPGGGYTGAPKESNCTSCHSGSVKATKTLIDLTGIPSSGYILKDTFHMVISYLHSTTGKTHAYGFEVTAIDSSTNKFLGKFVITDKTNTQTTSYTPSTGLRSYVEHTSSGIKAAAGKSWKFNWVAPSSGTATIVFYVTVNSANNDGTDGSDTIYTSNFHYKPAATVPVAAFTYSPKSICIGSSISFKDASTGSPTHWNWTFKDGTMTSTSTSQNPTHTFSNSGTDSVILTIKDTNGLTSTTRSAVTVNILPVATISGKSGAICYGDSVQLTASGGSTYLWSNGSKSSSIYVKDSASYTVTATNASGCSSISSAYKQAVLAPVKAPTLKASRSSICYGASLTIKAASGYSNYTFMDGSTMLTSGSADSFLTSSLAAGTHSFVVYGKNASGCLSPASTAVSVTVNSLPTVSLSANSGGKYCSGDNATLTATSGLASYSFYKNSTLISSSSNTATFAASTINSTDVFSVNASNASGCTNKSNTLSLSYAPKLKPAFGYVDNKGTVSFKDSTKGASRRAWNFGDKSATDTNANPTHV
jgi:PKD repeat protein